MSRKGSYLWKAGQDAAALGCRLDSSLKLFWRPVCQKLIVDENQFSPRLNYLLIEHGQIVGDKMGLLRARLSSPRKQQILIVQLERCITTHDLSF